MSRFGTLAGTTACGPFHQATPNQCLLLLEQVAGARFLIRHGQEIVVERREARSEERVRGYLLGSALAALLYQRQIVPLHGSVIAIPDGAVLLAGASGAGKSTLAAFLAGKGHRVLADDLCAITLDEAGRPLAHPAWPVLRLPADSLARLGLDPWAGLRLPSPDDKYLLSLPGRVREGPLPLQAVYTLAPAAVSEPHLTRLGGHAAAVLLQREVYRGEYAGDLGRLPLLFETVTAVAAHARVYRVERPARHYMLEALAQTITDTWSTARVAIPARATQPVPA